MLWGILISFVLIFAVLYSIRRISFFQLEAIPTTWLYLTYGLKLIAACALLALYSIYYTNRADADLFKYFDDALVIYESPYLSWDSFTELVVGNARSESTSQLLKDTQHWDRGEQLLVNDNRLMTLINLILLPISKGFYLFHLFVFTTLSFLGGVALFRFFRVSSSIASKPIFFAVFVPPSVLLWTSGLLKESLFIFFFGFFLYYLNLMRSKKEVYSIIGFILCLFFLLSIKSYLLICFFPSLLILFFEALKRWSIVISLAISSFLFFYFQAEIIAEIIRVQSNFLELKELSQAKSSFQMEAISSLKDFMIQIPLAFYNVWIRPIHLSSFSLLNFLNSIESLLYPLLLIATFFFRRKEWRKDWKIIAVSFLFVINTSILIGSTVPVIGAIVRYRSPIIIFFLIALFTFVDWKRIKISSL